MKVIHNPSRWTRTFDWGQWIFGIGFDVKPFAFRIALGPFKAWWK